MARALLALAILTAGSSCGAEPDRPPRPNVIVFMIDTLRADHLSCYGYPKNTTPNLDAFARESVLFEKCYAVAPATAPSHASLFTSTYPASHGIWNDVSLGADKVHPRLAPAAVTLAETLAEHGYRTAAIADGGWVIEERGLAQGFQHFESKNLGVVDRVARAMAWLDQARRKPQPFFLFLHNYQVHTPYLPPPGYEERFAGDYQGRLRSVLARAREYAKSPEIENPLTDVQQQIINPEMKDLSPADLDFLKALYDAELSLVDEQFALFLSYLRIHGLLDQTIVVVTSDHGEEFGEHGEFGHKQVYDECLHVPLLVRVPGGPRGLRRADLVETVDLMPSLLAALELPVPAAAVGRALPLGGPGPAPPPPLFVAQHNQQHAQVAVRQGDWKTVFHEDRGGTGEVFRVDLDPRERAPQPAAEELLGKHRAALEAWLEEAAAWRRRHSLDPVLSTAEDLTPEQRAELQALGYADG